MHITIEEITKLNDPLEIIQLRDEVDADIKKIEADLEFYDGNNYDWERRAKSALAAHRVIMGHLTRRLKSLTKKADITEQEVAAKVEKKRINLENHKLMVEQNRLSNEKKIKHIEMEKAKSVERLSFYTAFHKAATEKLSAENYAIVAQLAANIQAKEATK